MGRPSMREERRAQMVHVFCDIAKQKGVENTSLADVARKMDINVSLTLHYFDSKEELLVTVSQHILSQYSALFSNLATIETVNTGNLKELINKLFSRSWNELFDDALFYDFYAMTYRNVKLKSEFEVLHRNLRSGLANILVRAKENGVIDIKNPEESSVDVFTILDGWYYMLGLISDDDFQSRRAEKCKKIVYDLLGLC